MATLTAQHIRDAVDAGIEARPDLVERLRRYLVLDAENQADAGEPPAGAIAASAMLAEFDRGPTEWARRHLL